MPRPLTEFIYAQNVPWQVARLIPGREASQIKMLSEDLKSQELSAILRLPEGFDGSFQPELDEEVFVLDGSLLVDGQLLGRDGYVEVAAGTKLRWQSEGGADLLFFRNDPDSEIEGSGVRCVDALRMPWDTSHVAEGLEFLAPRLKVLKRDNGGVMRTYLLGTPPHSYPDDFTDPALTHPCVEECFMLGGELTGPLGVMTQGSYFWRPPHIPHGPYGSRDGSLALFRWREGIHVNEWQSEPKIFAFDTPYRPELPDELRAEHSQPFRTRRY